MDQIILKFLGGKPTSKGQLPKKKYRGDMVFCDLNSKDEAMHEAMMPFEKAGQLLASFPKEWKVKGKLSKEDAVELSKAVTSYENRMIGVAETTKGVNIEPTKKPKTTTKVVPPEKKSTIIPAI